MMKFHVVSLTTDVLGLKGTLTAIKNFIRLVMFIPLMSF